MVDRPHRPSALAATPLTSASAQTSVDLSADRVTARLPTGESVSVLLYGAHVLSWKSNGGAHENLWLSDAAALDGSKAVRGGIPICFPNFGPPPANHATSSLKQHGFARTSKWEYLGKSPAESEGGGVKLDFGLGPSNLASDARSAWPFAFGLVYSVTLTPAGLRTMLQVRNEGREPFEFQMLLHTYFAVKDITQTTITGLLGTTYVDKVLNATTHTESHARLPIAGEVDRVYSAIPQSTTSVLGADGAPALDVERDNLRDTVVWNPWVEKSKGMGDFEPKDGYKRMVCVEVGAVDGWTRLEAGESFEAGQLVKSHL